MNWQDLLKRKRELSLIPVIANIADHADEWNYLAMEFEAIGFKQNAEYCRARSKNYRDLAPAAYEAIRYSVKDETNVDVLRRALEFTDSVTLIRAINTRIRKLEREVSHAND